MADAAVLSLHGAGRSGREETEQADVGGFASQASVQKWPQNVIMGSELPSYWLASDFPSSKLNSRVFWNSSSL